MTLQEITMEIMKEADKYSVLKETDVPKMVQARTHKKWRTNKKWKKRYGMKMVYEKKMAQVIDVTIDLIIEWCSEHNQPLPDEFLTTLVNEVE